MKGKEKSAKSQTSVGGSAAIYGFLHQLTASMQQLVDAQFETIGNKADSNTITAVLEPSAGGDLTIDAPHSRRVIQFKHRNRPLSITDVSQSVLPDLYRAHCDNPSSSYEIQTTNGLSKPSLALLDQLKEWARAAKQDRPSLEYESQFPDLLNRAEKIFKDTGEASGEFRSNFAGFLRRVDVPQAQHPDEVRSEILGWLNTRVPYAEKSEPALDQLVGYLMEKAKLNDRRISIDGLLAQLGLESFENANPDHSLGRLSTILQTSLEERAYNPQLDIRGPLTVDRDATITLVSGKSGCGKSWALYRLAHDLNAKGRPTLLVRASDLTDLQSQVATMVAARALRHEQPVEPTLAGQLWRRANRSPDDVITVLWEGCRNADTVIDLGMRGGLGAGLSLVAELPASEEDRTQELDRFPTYNVGEFSSHQLFEALEVRGISAGKIPITIRKMLRLPVLCGIYASLAMELDDWDPLTEYRVLEDFWARARKRAGKLAGSKLKNFARLLVQTRQTYLLDDQVDKLGFGEAELVRLIQSGWLANVGERWSFAHDRLLTWSIAKALASDFADSAIDANKLTQQVIELQSDGKSDRAGLNGLGFLLMDVIWLICEDSERADEVARVLRGFEPEQVTGQSTLYRELLPTAGPLITPVLIARAKTVDEDDVVEAHICTSFRGVKLETQQQADLLSQLWEIDAGVCRSIAISLGQEWPMHEQRDEIWSQFCTQNADRQTDEFDYDLFQRLENALKSVAKDDPSWLDKILSTETDHEKLRLAAYLLKSLDVPVGAPIWKASRAKLLDLIPKDKHALLVECIGRFSDDKSAAILVDKITSGDRSARIALGFLAAIDPSGAIEIIEQNPALDHLPYGRDWIDRLLDFDHQRASAAMTSWLLDRDPSGRDLANLWHAVKERVDWPVLTRLMKLLHVALKISKETPQGRLQSLLALLGSLTLNPKFDGQFASYRDSELAGILYERALNHFEGEKDAHYVAVRRLLRRIGGKHYEKLILHALSPNDLSQARTGILSSFFCPTERVVARLEFLAENCTYKPEDDPRAKYEDDPRIALWRTLFALRPEKWNTSIAGMLEGSEADDIKLGLFLIRNWGTKTDLPLVYRCLERSAPNSDIEALAMNLAATLGPPTKAMTDRAIARLEAKTESDDEGRISCLNVLLNDDSKRSRDRLDTILASLSTAKSWKSTDVEALAIRLRQEDVGQEPWQAADRMVKSPFGSAEDVIESYLGHAPEKAMDILLERGFAPPHMFTSLQPNALRALAKADRDKATEAFVLAWKQHPSRRRYLAKIVRCVDEVALTAMIDHLHEDFQRGMGNYDFRAACCELRRAHEIAVPILIETYRSTATEYREALCEAIGWMPGYADLLTRIIETEIDPSVRSHAIDVKRRWQISELAIEQFRSDKTLTKLEYMIDVSDPITLCALGDPWRVIEDIQTDPALTIYAETQLARRYNDVQGSSIRRVRVKPR